MGAEQSGASPLPDKKGSVKVDHTNSRSEATKPSPWGRFGWGQSKAERHLFPTKKAP